MLHDHRTPRPHFDLRLEEDGVLRSWAVPRGLPVDAGANRLAGRRDGSVRYALIRTSRDWLLHLVQDQLTG